MNWLSNKIKNSGLYKGLRYFSLFNPIKPDQENYKKLTKRLGGRSNLTIESIFWEKELKS
jgi:hypothetical protein